MCGSDGRAPRQGEENVAILMEYAAGAPAAFRARARASARPRRRVEAARRRRRLYSGPRVRERGAGGGGRGGRGGRRAAVFRP